MGKNAIPLRRLPTSASFLWSKSQQHRKILKAIWVFYSFRSCLRLSFIPLGTLTRAILTQRPCRCLCCEFFFGWCDSCQNESDKSSTFLCSGSPSQEMSPSVLLRELSLWFVNRRNEAKEETESHFNFTFVPSFSSLWICISFHDELLTFF